MTYQRKYLSEDDITAYTRLSQQGPCFVCQIVRGESDRPHHIVYRDDLAIAFLNIRQLMLGYTLVAPREHREQVVGDFTPHEYVALQRLIHAVGRAVQRTVPTERLYVLSLGSQQGNRHVHWHIAPLPPGVSYERQQLSALGHQNGYIDLSEDEQAALARRIAGALSLELGHSTAPRQP